MTRSGSPPKARDVVAHPFECRDLVEQSVISGHLAVGFRGQCRVGHEAQRTESIIDRNDHDASFREIVSEVIGFVGESVDVASPVDPDHHGLRRIAAQVLRPDVQVEAVLPDIRQVGNLVRRSTEFLRDVAVPVGIALQLRARGPKARSVLVARTGHMRLGRAPAQFANRRGRVGNPAENSHPAVRVHVRTDENFSSRFDDGHLGWGFRAPRDRCQPAYASTAEASRQIGAPIETFVPALIKHPLPPLCRGRGRGDFETPKKSTIESSIAIGFQDLHAGPSDIRQTAHFYTRLQRITGASPGLSHLAGCESSGHEHLLGREKSSQIRGRPASTTTNTGLPWTSRVDSIRPPQ